MLESGYIGLTILIFGLIFRGYLSWKQKTVGLNKVPQIILPIIVWTVYIMILSFSGILRNLELPPRFPLLLFLPFFILTSLFFFKYKDNAAFRHLPLKWTTLYQSFRILVETLLLYTFYKGIIPKTATFEGYNFDILIGISAIPIGLFLVNNIQKNKSLLLAWNIVGILMILFVGFIIGTSFYAPFIWGSETPTVSLEFVSFPYILIPGFLAPSGIFMHVVSIIQIRNKT